MDEEILKILKTPEILKYGKFVLRAGQGSNFYVDIKKAYGIPRFFMMACEGLHKIIDRNLTCVGGMGVGGIPLASVYSALYSTPAFFIRNGSKNYGTSKQVEGYHITKDDKAVILDDVFSTGSSIKESAKVVEEMGARVIQGCVILRRNKKDIGFPVNSILSLEDLLK